jgi:hypothetical protein
MKERSLVKTEKDWNLIQVSFIKAHEYFTKTNKKLREQQKQKHLEMVEAMV